jgi:hypothetical protein
MPTKIICIFLGGFCWGIMLRLWGVKSDLKSWKYWLAWLFLLLGGVLPMIY